MESKYKNKLCVQRRKIQISLKVAYLLMLLKVGDKHIHRKLRLLRS